jgi:hypothetical protein
MVMTALKPWYVLDVDVSNAIRPDFDFDQFLKQLNGQSFYLWKFNVDCLENIVKKSWLDCMRDLDLDILEIQLFYRAAYATHDYAHVDYIFPKPHAMSASLNWCISKDSADMVWYDMPDYIPDQSNITNAKTVYTEWPLKELNFQSRCRIGNTCTLVRVDVPHHVFMGSDDRWCISARTQKKFNSWSTVIDACKDIIKC